MTAAPVRNPVPYPPAGLIVAIQYWAGDEIPAMRLARLMADIEPMRRKDVILAFCRRFDTPISPLAQQTFLYCGMKFGVMQLLSAREGTGHPHGSNELWAGTMEALATSWQAGRLPAASVFTAEADGVPLKRDWLDLLKAEHEGALWNGKRVTGCRMTKAVPHVNGQLVAHLSLWVDRPSLHQTPAEHAWDMYHSAAFLAEVQHTTLISNPYGTTELSDSVLTALAHETCWLSNTKDASAVTWAERTLVERAAPRDIGTDDTPPAGRRVSVRG